MAEDEAYMDQAFARKTPYGIGHEPGKAGALSLFRRGYSRDLRGVDMVISGVPFDHATTNRPGARFGPRAIRAASTDLAWMGSSWPWGFDPFEHLAAIDYGDCHFDHGDPASIPAAIETHADHILASGASMLTLGGDHFITYPLLRAHEKVHGPVSLIHFDAHSDTWRDEDPRVDHGTMFFHAAQENLVVPEHSVQIGLRTFNEETHGFNILDTDYVHTHGPHKVIESVREIVGDRKAYLTFDIDCLDPMCAPGTGTPVVGGLNTWQALTIVRGLQDLNLVGMDVVEVAPDYDIGEVTALAAATLAFNYVCIKSKQKAQEHPANSRQP